MSFDTRVVVSAWLPHLPSHGEVARRIVRHALAEVLEWLGEEPGPKPGDLTQAAPKWRLLWVPAVADPHAPTVDELNAGLDLSCFITDQETR